MRFISVLFLLLFFSSNAYAGKSCYSMPEAEAEQGIRIHSELMVIGLNCQHLAPLKEGQNLFQRYRIFTAKHANLFSTYDATIMKFYKKQGLSNKEAEKKLNDIRTSVANRISNDAAKMRPDIFCKHYAPRIEKASQMSQEKIRKWAQTFFESHPISYPLCTQAEARHKETKIKRQKYLIKP